jgi:hypothetical protein
LSSLAIIRARFLAVEWSARKTLAGRDDMTAQNRGPTSEQISAFEMLAGPDSCSEAVMKAQWLHDRGRR